MSISAINLGSSYLNSNGTSVLNGFSSGLNTSSIIDSLVSAQTTQVTNLTDQITVNNSQSSALSSLSQILTQFQTAANALASPQSPDSTTNLFAFRTSQLTSNTTQAASNYLSANVATSAALGTYTISNISQLAQATTQETNGFTLASADSAVVGASAVAGQFTAGTFTVNGQNITLTAGETLNQVAAAFNAVATSTGINASVVETAAGSSTNTYKLVFNGSNTGLANGFDLSSSSTVTSDPSGVLSKLTFANDQLAQDAQFDFNGVAVTRATNSVGDLASGVTFNLLQDTASQPNASFSVTVAPDTTSIANGVTNFVNAYNSFLGFYAQQTQIDSTTGAPATTAVLYSDTSLQTIYNQLTTQVSSIVSGLTSGNPQTLNDLGISFTDVPATSTTPAVSNELSVDSTTLQNALTSNLSSVENVFGYNATSSSANLAVYQPPTDQSISNFQVSVDQVNQVYTASYTDASGNAQTVNLTAASLGSGTSLSLSAPSTSGLAGLVLIYGGSGSESNISISSTNGIASQVNNFLTAATDQTTGLIATDQQAIAAKNTATQTQITNINNQITQSRQQLLAKFSALEAAISQANSSINYLNAQQSATTNG